MRNVITVIIVLIVLTFIYGALEHIFKWLNGIDSIIWNVIGVIFIIALIIYHVKENKE